MSLSPAAAAGAPTLAPDVDEQRLAETMDAATAHVPSSDEELMEEANVAKGTNAEELQNQMRILMDRMEQMNFENKALQNKLNARDKHIENLTERLRESIEKTERLREPTEKTENVMEPVTMPKEFVVSTPKASPAEEPAPPADAWAAAASALPARLPQPAEAATSDPTGLEGKFLKLLEVVSTQSSEISAMRADMQSWQDDWQNYPASAQAFPTAPTTPWPPTTSTTTRALAPIDRKVIDKPYKYGGDTKVFIQWQSKLKDY